MESFAVTSIRNEILNSWVHRAPSLRDLADLLGLPAPIGLRDILTRLRVVETVRVGKDVETPEGFPLGGRTDIVLRSDGSYEFSGHMRATGLTSYHYGVQVWVQSGGQAVIAAQKMGNVYGSDTPFADREQGWTETGINRGIATHWRALRQDAGLGYRIDAEMGGVLGSAKDVLSFALNGLLLGAVIGPAGWLVLIGTELGDMDAKLGAPDTLAGILVGAGTFYLVGPFGLLPAIVAGAATVALADIRHRPMEQFERDFADRVFRGKIDYDKVILTNLSRDGARKFTIPSVGGAILVNLDDAYDSPVNYFTIDPATPPDAPVKYPGGNYPEPGSVFIHELTHAWQIKNNTLDGVIDGLSDSYSYFDGIDRTIDTSWAGRSFRAFDNEQQAHIVDDWYGAFVRREEIAQGKFHYFLDEQGLPITYLDGVDALNDPAYPFIRDNIRAGVP